MTFAAEQVRAAAVSVLTLPGAKLLHEGQLEGRRVRLPVFLSRRPDESPDRDLQAFYQRLLTGNGARTFSATAAGGFVIAAVGRTTRAT